jgi:hypothetical protein
LRFAVHWPGNPVASPRFHSVPRRDITCRVNVSVTGETAGHTSEEGLALAALRCDVPARRATLARVRGWYSFDPSWGLVLKPLYEPTPARPKNSSVQASFLADIPAWRFWSPLRRPGHAPDVKVLDTNHIEPACQISAGLLAPVLPSRRIAGFRACNCRLDFAAPLRPTFRLSELPLHPAQLRHLTGSQSRAVQEFARRQRSRHGDAQIHADNLSLTGAENRGWSSGKRDMPAAHVVTRYPVRLHTLRNLASPPEPNPPRLRDLDLCPVPVQAAHIARTNGDNPKSLITPLLTPRRTPVRPRKEILHGLVEITKRLLLDHLAALAQPRAFGSSGGELSALFKIARCRPPTRTPPGMLLDRQVPHKPGIPAMPQKSALLLRSRDKAITRHTNILTDTGGDDSSMRKTLFSHALFRLSLQAQRHVLHRRFQ